MNIILWPFGSGGGRGEELDDKDKYQRENDKPLGQLKEFAFHSCTFSFRTYLAVRVNFASVEGGGEGTLAGAFVRVARDSFWGASRK